MRILKDFIYSFADRLLREAGISEEIREDDLESMVYESGARNWEDDEDYFYIPEDYY